MNVAATSLPAVRMTVRPLETNVFVYLWRTLANIRYLPPAADRFLLALRRQTIMGWWWIIIRALLPTLGIIMILQHVPTLSPASMPYPLYVVSAMVLWTALTNSLTYGTRALKATRRVHFRLVIPKLIYVIAAWIIPAIYTAVFAIVLALLLIYYYFWTGTTYVVFDWPLLLLPIPVIVCFLLSIGITSFTSVIFLFARDAKMVFALVTQFWFYVTPIIYTVDILPPSWQVVILYGNPMTSLIEMFRWCLFGVGGWTTTSLTCAIVASLVIFLLGARFVMRSEWVMREVV